MKKVDKVVKSYIIMISNLTNCSLKKNHPKEYIYCKIHVLGLDQELKNKLLLDLFHYLWHSIVLL